jgi:DNA-binding response OmpR family regulator
MTTPTHRTQIVVYSDDSTVRAFIVSALGRRISEDLAEHEIVEFATADALRLYIDRRGSGEQCRADLFILDGEAVPEGGMSVARQLKDEVFECPPVLVIIGRADDAWLAAWSRADGVLMHPIDPFVMASTIAKLLRPRSLTTA